MHTESQAAPGRRNKGADRMRLLLAEDERALSRALCKILDKNGYPTEIFLLMSI